MHCPAGRLCDAPTPAAAEDPTAFRAAWQAYADGVNAIGRQRDCAPLVNLERRNERRYAAVPPGLPIQLVAAGDERYVSARRIEKFAARHTRHGPTALCRLPDHVPQEMP